MKQLRRLLLVLAAALLLPLLLVAWLLGSESGLHAGLQGLERLLAPAFTVESAQGRIAGAMHLQGVRYENDAVSFTAEQLELDWQPLQLLSGLLDIERLAAAGVRYEQRSVSEAPAEPVRLPDSIRLPLAMQLQAAAVERLIVISAPGAQPLGIDSITLGASWRDTVLQLQALAVQQSQLQLQGGADLDMQGDYPLQATLDWRLTVPDYAPLTGATRLDGSLRELRVDQRLAAPYALQAQLRLRELLTALRLEGTVELAGSALQDINPDWPDMQLRGSVLAAGAPDDLQLQAALDLQEALAGALRLLFDAQLQPDALQVARLELTAPGRAARLEGSGRIGLGAQPVFDFRADWQELAWPLQGEAQYRSRNGRFALQGSVQDYRLDLHGDLLAADWLRGDLQLQARSLDAAGNWLLEQAVLSDESSRLQVAGQVGQRYALDWSLESRDLSGLLPRAAGQLSGSGRVEGTLSQPAIRADLNGSSLRWQQQAVGRLDLRGSVDMSGAQKSQFTLALQDADLPGVAVSALELGMAGTPREHTVRIKTSTDRGALDWRGSGDWDGKRWAFAFRRANLRWSGLAEWRLADAVTGSVGGAALDIERSCWQSGPASACLQLQVDTARAQGEFSIDRLAANYFAPLLPPRLAIDSVLAAQGSFSMHKGRIGNASIEVTATPGSVQLAGEGDQEATSLVFDAVQAHLDVQDNHARLDLALPLARAQGRIEAHATLQAARDADWLQGSLNGEALLDWPDISLAAQWLPEVSALAGRLDGRVALSGTPAAPQMQGTVRLSDARATLDRPGLELEQVMLSLEGTPQGTVRMAASLQSGGGTLRGDGEYRLRDSSGQFRIQGEQFQVAGLPEVAAYASPDLELSLSQEVTRIRGQVSIPRATIRARQPPASAVGVSPDQIIITQEQPNGDQGDLLLDVDVAIRVGDEVTLEGFGLSGGLKGNLRIIDPPRQPATATGELAISDGLYQAYGQELAVTTGRLLYAGGALDEPGLDIEAVRKPAPDITVGVKVRGKLRTPKVTVFSRPPMQQSEQLSWLVLGRPLRGGSDNERSALGSAALAMGLGAGESIGQQIGGALGFDEVSVGSEPGGDVSQSSLLIGKYLTPELFVSYGIGLFEPIATLRLRYALSSRWRLVGETSATGSAADLIYELERR